MKAKDLAEKLMDYPDFDVDFSFMERGERHLNLRTFENVDIGDIGHSDKIIKLSGKEI